MRNTRSISIQCFSQFTGDHLKQDATHSDSFLAFISYVNGRFIQSFIAPGKRVWQANAIVASLFSLHTLIFFFSSFPIKTTMLTPLLFCLQNDLERHLHHLCCVYGVATVKSNKTEMHYGSWRRRPRPCRKRLSRCFCWRFMKWIFFKPVSTTYSSVP